MLYRPEHIHALSNRRVTSTLLKSVSAFTAPSKYAYSARLFTHLAGSIGSERHLPASYLLHEHGLRLRPRDHQPERFTSIRDHRHQRSNPLGDEDTMRASSA